MDRGDNPNLRGAYGQAPLIYAASCGHEAIVQLLLDRGADVNSQDNGGRTALSVAVRCNHKATAELLLSGGAKVICKIIMAWLHYMGIY